MALLTLSSAAVPPDQDAELLEGEPGDLQALFDGLLTEGFEQERLARPRRPADHQVLPAADPLQRLEGLLSRERDGTDLGLPGVEGLPGWERRRGPAGGQGGAGPAGGLLGEQSLEDLGGFPPLRLRGRQDLGGVPADVRQAQAAQQQFQVLGQRRRRRDTQRGCGRCGARGTAAPAGCDRGRDRGGHRVTSLPSTVSPAPSAWSSPGTRSWSSAPSDEACSPARCSAAQALVPWVRLRVSVA